MPGLGLRATSSVCLCLWQCWVAGGCQAAVPNHPPAAGQEPFGIFWDASCAAASCLGEIHLFSDHSSSQSGAKATLPSMQDHRKAILACGSCHRILREGRNIWKFELQTHQRGLVQELCFGCRITATKPHTRGSGTAHGAALCPPRSHGTSLHHFYQ